MLHTHGFFILTICVLVCPLSSRSQEAGLPTTTPAPRSGHSQKSTRRKRVWLSIWVRPAGVSTIRWPSCVMCRGRGMMSTSSSLPSSGQPWTADTQEPASSRALQNSAMAHLQGKKSGPYHRGQAGPSRHSFPFLPCPHPHIGERGQSTATVSPAMPTAGSALEERQRIQLTPGPVHRSSSETQGLTQGSKKPHPRQAAEPLACQPQSKSLSR